MSILLKRTGTITQKGQITVPKAVRDALGVAYGGQIAFFVDANQRVTPERVDEDEDDPVIDRFLDFLQQDMAKHPQTSIRDIPASLRDRIQRLIGTETLDPDAPIDGDVDL